jgi:hypothetical protein
MDVDTCMLCDAATVREGLLHILGGGITQTVRPEFPSPLGISLALRVLAHPTETAHPHKLEVILQDEDGERIVKFQLQIAEIDEAIIPVGEQAPITLAWDFPGKPVLPHPGRYSFELLIDGVHQRTVPLNAVLVEQEGGDDE